MERRNDANGRVLGKRRCWTGRLVSSCPLLVWLLAASSSMNVSSAFQQPVFFNSRIHPVASGEAYSETWDLKQSTRGATSLHVTELAAAEETDASTKASAETQSSTAETQSSTTEESSHDVRFISPLLEYGYRDAVEEFENGTLSEKPLLLYLPGFDSTFLAPFIQFPELGTICDVRCMIVGTEDRSSFDYLKETVLWYLKFDAEESNQRENGGSDRQKERNGEGEVRKDTSAGKNSSNRRSRRNRSSRRTVASRKSRPVYLIGESFGGILASEVAICILRENKLASSSSTKKKSRNLINLQGLTVINAATCFDRSRLAAEGPGIAELPLWLYPAGLAKLLPLFTDEYSMEQLFLILQSKALPSVIDNAMREAYMGRMALSLPFVVPVLSQDVLWWRLSEWLVHGCERMATRLMELKEHHSDFRTLVIAGEKDLTLPSIDEAERLASILPNPQVHVVEGAGHASTCGSRVDLAALLRGRFTELQQQDPSGRTRMKDVAAAGQGAYLGMEPRYDGAAIGLNPLLYWSKKYYRKHKPQT